MSSTDLDAPPLRAVFMAIVIVVGLHVLTAAALVAIQPPEMKIEPEKEKPPIEIELVTPPPPPPVEIEEKKVEEKKSEPVRKVKTQPKAKPKAAPVKKYKPKSATKPVAKATTPKVPVQKPVTKDNTQKITKPVLQAPVDDSFVEDEQRRIIAAKAEKAAQAEREAQRLADAKAAREAQALVDANAKAAKAAAAKQAEEAAQEKAAAAAANSQPVDTGPVNLSAGEASWRVEPRLGFLANERSLENKGSISVTASITVDAKGNITKAAISPSTGNNSIDNKIIRAIRKAKLSPFIRNGVAVKGTVTLPVFYEIK